MARENMGRSGKISTSLYSKFIGRDSEFAELSSQLDESISGNGRLVLLVGEMGIGKSRLAEELGKYAATKNVLYLKGKSLYKENAEPYLPFVEAFSGYQTSEKEYLEEDSRAVMGGFGDEPFSMGLLPLRQNTEVSTVIKKAGLNIQQERDRLFESICNLVIEISNERPLLLVLDDLQWADDGTLQVLHYLARNIRNNKVLICGTYCPEDMNNNGGPSKSLPETIRRMRIEKLVKEIRLDRFNEECTTLMIESLVGKHGLPNGFAKVLYKESEGNPFFIEEVLKSLVNEGLIDVASYKWAAQSDFSQIRIPGTVKDVIARRIDTLDDKTKSILKVASVIGNSFTFDILYQISDVEEETVIDAIDASIAVNIIHEDSSSKEERYKFDHALIREIIYTSMSKSRRRLMHKRIGIIIEKMNMNNLDEVAYILARHFKLGKDVEKTLLYAVLAGDRASKVFAPEEAINYYVMALRALEQMDIKTEIMVTKLGVVSKLGEIFNMIGQWDVSLGYQNQALNLSKKIGNDLERARALRTTGHIKQNKGEYDEALDNFQQGLDISGKIEDIHGLADTYRGLGRVFWRKGEFDSAINNYEKGLSLAQEILDEKLMATIYIELANIYSERGNWDKAIEYHTSSLNVLEKLKDFYEIGRSYNNLGVTYARKGDVGKAIEEYEKCIEISDRTGNIRMTGWALFNAAEAYAKLGELKKAEECCDRSLSIFEKLDEKLGISGAYMSYGIIFKLQRNWNKAIQYFEKSMRIRKELEIPYRLADGYYEFGMLYKDKGDSANAVDCLNKAKEIFGNLGAADYLEKIETEMKTFNA
jgi:tetratricopeptide (TPR) repeat protein